MVLTATLGERESLKRTIESVRTIGGGDVRHVIICPSNRIQAIKDKYGEIECLAEPEGRKGIYAALNYGFRKYGSEHQYLTFINDDDYWLPGFAQIIKIIKEDNSIDLVYGRTRYVNENNIQIGSQSCYPAITAFIPLLKHDVIMFTQQATLIKSSLYFDIGGFDETYKLVADTKFWAEASLMNIKYRYLDKECAAYMIQSGQLSSDHALQQKEHERLLKELKCSSKIYLCLVRYRLLNIPLYLKRLLKVKGYITKPYMMSWLNVLIVFLPWRIRRYVLNKYYLYDIAPSAKIGISYIYPTFLKMGEGAHIGHFNMGIHLSKIILGKNSSIARGNWITGFPVGTESEHFAHDKNRKSELIIGDESAITKNHHIDCTNAIHIGNYVTVAGYNSQFLTHSIDIYNNRQDSHPISIGDYSFVSTGVKVLGGSTLPAYSVLAAGAVLNKRFSEEFRLYGGVPAEKKKILTEENVKYFQRSKGFVV